jgi:hypothetical protein
LKEPHLTGYLLAVLKTIPYRQPDRAQSFNATTKNHELIGHQLRPISPLHWAAAHGCRPGWLRLPLAG